VLGVSGQVGVGALPDVVGAEGEVFGGDDQGALETARWCGNAEMQGGEADADNACAEAVFPVADDGGERGGVVVVVQGSGFKGPVQPAVARASAPRGDLRQDDPVRVRGLGVVGERSLGVRAW
jgi:hypothetical protein